MFRPQGEAPDRAAEVAAALEGGRHEVRRVTVRRGLAAVPRVMRDAEVIHAIGLDATGPAARAARLSGSALVCEPLPDEDAPGGSAGRALRTAAFGRRGGAVIARDQDQASRLQAQAGLPYLPPVVGDLARGAGREDPGQMLLAVYERLPHLNPEFGIEGAATTGRLRRWLGELGEPIRRGALRHPGALLTYLRGRRLRARGKHAGAVEALSRAARHSGDPVYDLYLVKALREAGEPERALQTLEALGSGSNLDPALLGEVGVELTRFGRTAQGLEVARRLAGDRGGAEHWAEAARVYAAAGDLESARRLALKAAERAADGSDAQRIAARALEFAGEPSRALELARRAGEKDQERRLGGLLRELEPGWAPQLGTAKLDGHASDIRILALLEVSLPQAPSGYAYRSRDLLAALRDVGFEPFAATRLGFPASRGALSWSPVESVDAVVHHRFNVPGMRQYSGVPLDLRVQENAERLLDLARRARPSAIIAATPDLNGVTALALRSATGVPVVYDVRGFPEMSWAAQAGGSDTELYRLRRDAETACASAADGVITLSETMREELAGRGVDASRIHVVPHIVDADRFAPRPRNPELARSYGLAGKLVVGSVTSLTDYEGIDDLLRAVALALPRWPELATLIVGDGRYRPALESLVEDLGIADSVVFTGRLDQEQVPDHYALLDLFAIPRRDLEVCRAVTPLKPFEALSMEIPVIASDLPALTEIVSASGGGRTFAPGSERALAELILELGGNQGAREQLGRSGREHVLAHHTAERATDAVHAALEPILGKNER